MEIEKSLSVGEFPLKEVTVWVRRARRARRAARPPPPLAQLRLHSAVGGARRKRFGSRDPALARDPAHVLKDL